MPVTSRFVGSSPTSALFDYFWGIEGLIKRAYSCATRNCVFTAGGSCRVKPCVLRVPLRNDLAHRGVSWGFCVLQM